MSRIAHKRRRSELPDITFVAGQDLDDSLSYVVVNKNGVHVWLNRDHEDIKSALAKVGQQAGETALHHIVILALVAELKKRTAA